MPQRGDFEDVTLEIRGLEGERFQVQIWRGPRSAGQTASVTTERVDVSALRAQGGLLGRMRDLGMAPGWEASERSGREVGVGIFEAFLQGNVRRLFDECRSRANDDPRCGTARGLRLRLRLNLDDERILPVVRLPWEMLCDPWTQTFYGWGGRHLLVRHLESPNHVPPLPVTSALKILMIAASPDDLPHLEVKREARRLRERLRRNGRIQIASSRQASFKAVRRALEKEEAHVLHFMGHGDFDPDTGEGWLCFETESGVTERVEGEHFAALMRDFEHLKLIVLNACRSAEMPHSPGQSPGAAPGAALSLAGVPAVVAMQFPISDGGAIEFSEAFYRALADTGEVDVAAGVGRRELYAFEPRSLDWAAPVLFLRSEDGRIFDVRPAEETPAPRPVEGRRKIMHVDEEAAREEPLVLGIRSMEPLGDRPERTLDLTRHFDGREIRNPALWQSAVLPELKAFLEPALTSRRPLLLDFAAHASIAFAAGSILERKSGLDITVRQRLKDGIRNWKPDAGPLPDGPYWQSEEDILLEGPGADVAVAVSLTWPVLDDVRLYVEESKLPVRRLLPATLAPAPSPSGIQGGPHALALAEALALRIRARTPDERRGTLHLFISGPNAFLFYLGQLARGLGRIQLYEYDFHTGEPGAYRPGIALPE